MQYRVTGWGGLTSGAARKTAGKDTKYVKLISQAEERSAADVGADIVITDEEQQRREGGASYPAIPSKTRYQPGRDRAQRRKKK